MAKKNKKRSLGSRIRRIILLTPLALILFSVLHVVVLKWIPVYFTPLMIKRSIEYRHDPDFHTSHRWVPLEEISPELPKALITSEDNLFMEHHGFDWKSIEEARKWNEAHKDPQTGEVKRKRGASTISQQTAKNVFTTGRQTYLRKGFEAYYTILIEYIWGKRRIMEVYLNIIEFGPGVYGAQSAAQVYLGKDASKITRSEACTMAACVPNPLKRSISHPSSYVRKRAANFRKRIPNLVYPDWIETK